MLQISVQELYNDLFSPVSLGRFSGAINEDGILYVGDKSLRKYIAKHINPMSNINNNICGFETYIRSILIQYEFNYWRLTHLEKYEKLYNNAASTRILQRSNK